jgi:hypothetical protein
MGCTMKKTSTNKRRQKNTEDMQAEYRFDYKRARPNRFAGRIDRQQLVVVLDKDVSKVFSTPESVNTALRALISAIPKASKARKTA